MTEFTVVQHWEFHVPCAGRGKTWEEAWQDAKDKLLKNLDDDEFEPFDSERIYDDDDSEEEGE